jgi:hypothetical protein
MQDTPPEITEKMDELIRKKSPSERAKMGWSMYETSKQLVIRAILEEKPTISQAGLRKEVFLKFYGNDFSKEEQEKILEYLGQDGA